MERKLTMSLMFLAIVGIIVALVGWLLWAFGLAASFEYLVSYVNPMFSAVIGVTGLYLFGRQGMARDDMLPTTGLVLSLGIAVMALGEGAESIIGTAADPGEFYFAVALLQLPGLFLWSIGIIDYLFVFNRIVMSLDARRIAFGLIGTAVVVVAGLRLGSLMAIAQRSLIETLTSIPVLLFSVLIVLSLAFLAFQFRAGVIALPMGLLLLSFVLFLLQTLLWCSFAFGPLDPLVRGMALESYLVLGMALLTISRIDAV